MCHFLSPETHAVILLQTETEMSTLRHDYARLQDESEEKINSLTALVNQLQQEKSEVVAQLDDEKRYEQQLIINSSHSY